MTTAIMSTVHRSTESLPRGIAVPGPSSVAPRVQLSGHLPGLDGVRGLAISMVMITHFVGLATATTGLQRVVVKAAGYGLLGVDLFFVLSGFLITGLLLRAKGRPHYFRNFYARRTLRIFPLYYAVLLTLFVVLPALTSPSPMLAEAGRHQVWLWTYTSNVYLATVSSWMSLTYMNHFWSLAIEEHFYLLWPFVVFTCSRATVERVCIGVIVGGLALRIALALHGMSELSISVLTPCRIDTLCVGGLLAAVAHRDGGAEALVRRALPSAMVAATLVLVVSAWCVLTDMGVTTLHQVRETLYSLFFGAVVLLSLTPNSHPASLVFQNPALRFLGRYSYGLYVYHAILLWYGLEHGIEGHLDTFFGNHAVTMIADAVLGTAVSSAAAVLSYHLFEKHLLALKRYFETVETRVGSGRRRAGALSI